MNENKVKTMLNKEILNKMSDGAAVSVLKNILFSEDNQIDWDIAYSLMMTFMPELNNYEGYKSENMM